MQTDLYLFIQPYHRDSTVCNVYRRTSKAIIALHFSFIAYFLQPNIVERRRGTTGDGESVGTTLLVSVAQLHLWGTPPTDNFLKYLYETNICKKNKKKHYLCSAE